MIWRMWPIKKKNLLKCSYAMSYAFIALYAGSPAGFFFSTRTSRARVAFFVVVHSVHESFISLVHLRLHVHEAHQPELRGQIRVMRRSVPGWRITGDPRPESRLAHDASWCDLGMVPILVQQI